MTLRSVTPWIVLALGLCVAAQVTAAKTSSASHAPSSAAKFAKAAAQGGMAEVELGKIAVDKASNADVKTFAQRMVDDHGRANDELKTLASQKHWTLPTMLDSKAKSTMARLEKLSGAEFDREYMKDMVADHKHDVGEFRKYAKSGADPDLKAWASKTLPTLEEHETMAMTTAKAVGATTGTTKPMANQP